ncbi:hypothetical protein CDAR_365661 [Caerostris darwini]|uniref:Uncharacterized protein n=1 Tax=Caerostris darwini TaxID=1538125 RepID=A0AAV4RFJ9_9ARAC|nr:hypothetical protein CDAR_365661 [Caerostris darwini]
MAKELDTDERSFRLAPDPDGPLSLFFPLPSKSACLYLYLLFRVMNYHFSRIRGRRQKPSSLGESAPPSPAEIPGSDNDCVEHVLTLQSSGKKEFTVYHLLALLTFASGEISARARQHARCRSSAPERNSIFFSFFPSPFLHTNMTSAKFVTPGRSHKRRSSKMHADVPINEIHRIKERDLGFFGK